VLNIEELKTTVFLCLCNWNICPSHHFNLLWICVFLQEGDAVDPPADPNYFPVEDMQHPGDADNPRPDPHDIPVEHMEHPDFIILMHWNEHWREFGNDGKRSGETL